MVIINSQHIHHEEAVLTEALINAADYWEISNKQLSRICGLSEATISRLKKGHYIIDQKSKHWELSVLFLRIFRGLDAYLGGNIAAEIQWLNSYNSALGGVPLVLMEQISGLALVVHYIDAMRG